MVGGTGRPSRLRQRRREIDVAGWRVADGVLAEIRSRRNQRDVNVERTRGAVPGRPALRGRSLS